LLLRSAEIHPVFERFVRWTRSIPLPPTPPPELSYRGETARETSLQVCTTAELQG